MAIKEILSEIQVELKAPKGQTNTFGGYKFRSLEDIQEALKPLLAKHKAVILLDDSLECIGDRYYVKATATLYVGDESISVSAYAREEESKKKFDASQLTGSTSSYARKYAVNGLFAIDDTKDADATNKGEVENKRIDEKQLSRLIDYADKVGVKEARIKTRYKVTSLAELTVDQFEDAINRFKEAEKNAAT